MLKFDSTPVRQVTLTIFENEAFMAIIIKSVKLNDGVVGVRDGVSLLIHEAPKQYLLSRG